MGSLVPPAREPRHWISLPVSVCLHVSLCMHMCVHGMLVMYVHACISRHVSVYTLHVYTLLCSSHTCP